MILSICPFFCPSDPDIDRAYGELQELTKSFTPTANKELLFENQALKIQCTSIIYLPQKYPAH